MPIYSHSQLSVYEQCPLKYKLHYRDKIERDTEGVEAFLGNMVHETLRKCYDDARLTRVISLPELLSFYDITWQKSWHDAVVITREDVTREHYQALGKRMIETYYHRYAPFNADITIQTEMRLNFALDKGSRYKMTGFIDRLSRTGDGGYQIHDYKTSAHLPGQENVDHDRQLALYQLGVQRRWPDIKDIKLVWHYLAFDRDLVSSRSDEAIARLTADTTRLIDEIESALEFPPKESSYCDWCEYPDLCPARRHFHVIESLPPNEYLKEPGVVLINRYAELKEQAGTIGEEMDKVKEAIVEYARREGVTAMRGTGSKVRVKFDSRLRFPGKSEAERGGLDDAIVRAGKWMEVSQLDTAALTRIVGEGSWDRKLVEEVMKYGRIEDTSSVYLSKLKEGED
ncbi:MAG: PD-(D/E)XK nuclease family protein [Dehalococcoidia bacterium]|nr:PD-(D/E)XK nuclease family protein [Dehalococcoidia bacterium]